MDNGQQAGICICKCEGCRVKSKGASQAGTMASLIAGTIVVVYLEHISKGNLFGLHFNQPIVPGLVAALIAFFIFSLVMPPKKQTTELAPEE